MNKSRWALTAAAALVVAGIGVHFVGDQTLVRYPLNIDQKLQYQGTATVYVNPATGLPLSSPIKTPLTINRVVKVVSGSYSTAVIDETIATTFAGSTRTENYQYVMDRRSMKLVDSLKSFAFGQTGNAMTPSGALRINFPLGTSSTKTYTAWVPETASTIKVTSTSPAHHDSVSGASVVTFDTVVNHQVAPYYLTYLYGSGLPAQLPAATVQAELKANGADVSQVLAAVGPNLDSTQMATLTAALSQPVPLEYSYFQTGQIMVEPSTGAVVNGGSSREGVSVTADLSAMAPAEAILAPYAALPAVQALSKAVANASGPQVVTQMTYSETTASARSAAASARNQAHQMNLIRWELPGLLVALALLALLLAWIWKPGPVADVIRLEVPVPGETAGTHAQHRKGA